MRPEPKQLLETLPERMPAPLLDVETVWERGRRRRLRVRVITGIGAAVVLALAAVGLGSLFDAAPQQPVVGDGGPAPSGPSSTESHPVAVVEHEGERVKWREGCPIPAEAVLLDGDPAPVDADGDGDPDLPGAVTCSYPPSVAVDIPLDAQETELGQLRGLALAHLADLEARFTELTAQLKGGDSYRERVLQQQIEALEEQRDRLLSQLAEIERRLRAAGEPVQRDLTKQVRLPADVLAVGDETCPVYYAAGGPRGASYRGEAGLVVFQDGLVYVGQNMFRQPASRQPAHAATAQLTQQQLDGFEQRLQGIDVDRLPHWVEPLDGGVVDGGEMVFQVPHEGRTYEVRAYGLLNSEFPAQIEALNAAFRDLAALTREIGTPLGADEFERPVPQVDHGDVCGG